MSRIARIAPLSVLTLVLAAGCAGHGNYTKEGLSLAEQRAAQLKSGTEFSMAQQAFLAGDLDRALKRIDVSIAVNPTASKSHVLKGRILAERGELGPALESLRTATEVDPNSFEAFYYQGVIFERLTRTEDALAMYKKAAELDPTSDQYVVAASEMLIDLNRFEEAEQYILSVNDHFEHNAAVRQTLGHVYMLLGRSDDALVAFNEARLLAPDDPTVLEDLAGAQVASGRLAEAEFTLAQALRLPVNQNRRDLLHQRARCLVELDRPAEARGLLMELTKSPAGDGDADAWIALGRVSYSLGDERTLRKAAARSVSIGPDRFEGYLLRALVQRDDGKREAALASIDEALIRHHDEPTCLTLKGLILTELGRHSEAAQALRAALATDPANTSASQLLSVVDGGE